jgi:hypothetical protein
MTVVRVHNGAEFTEYCRTSDSVAATVEYGNTKQRMEGPLTIQKVKSDVYGLEFQITIPLNDNPQFSFRANPDGRPRLMIALPWYEGIQFIEQFNVSHAQEALRTVNSIREISKLHDLL